MDKDKNKNNNPNKGHEQRQRQRDSLNESRGIIKGFSSDKPKPNLPRMESKPPTGPKK